MFKNGCIELAKAKNYFELGVLKDAAVLAPVLSKGWSIVFTINTPEGDKLATLATQRGNDREFKTLDAAAKTIEKIGLKKFNVGL